MPVRNGHRLPDLVAYSNLYIHGYTTQSHPSAAIQCTILPQQYMLASTIACSLVCRTHEAPKAWCHAMSLFNISVSKSSERTPVEIPAQSCEPEAASGKIFVSNFAC